MPIDYVIDHDRRLVLAKGRGTLTHEDVFGYQREVWSRPEVNGYNELVDMSQVVHIALQSVEGVRELAKLSAGMDARSSASKFAIVAPTGEAFGLGRMYETYRGLDERSTKEVSVFRSPEEALEFLGASKSAADINSYVNRICTLRFFPLISIDHFTGLADLRENPMWPQTLGCFPITAEG